MIILTINGTDYDAHVFPEAQIDKIHTFTVDVSNPYTHNVTLKEPYADDPDLNIVSFDDVLAPGGKGQILFEFRPTASRPDMSPLDTAWGFRRVIHG